MLFDYLIFQILNSLLFLIITLESTELSKAFAKQGIKIPIRKETRYRRPHDDVRRVLEGPNQGATSLSVSDHDVDKSDNGEEKGAEYDSENDDDIDENNRKHRANP